MKFYVFKNKKIFSLALIIFSLPFQIKSHSFNKKEKIIQIEGEPETANITDLPLPSFDYDFNFFESELKAEEDLIKILDRPEELTGITEKEYALDFTEYR
jgi:hypothetical protein